MIKAIFFDLFNTLVTYKPSREDMQLEALGAIGLNARREDICRGIKSADEYFYAQNATSPMKSLSETERKKVWMGYETIVFQEAGLQPSPTNLGMTLGYMEKVKFEMALYDDVIPALDDLRKDSFVLGLISNIDKDISSMCQTLGLSDRLDVVVTSLDSGFFKPSPQIFQMAARKAEVDPDEAVYVGDQYAADVVGSRGAGMTGILIDRDRVYRDDQTDGYAILGMDELPGLIESINKKLC